MYRYDGFNIEAFKRSKFIICNYGKGSHKPFYQKIIERRLSVLKITNNYRKAHHIPMFRKPYKNKGTYRKWYKKKEDEFYNGIVESILKHAEKLLDNRKAKEDS